jgi:hypothetical protein
MKKRVELLERQMADRTRRIDKNERGGMMNQAAIEIANKDIGKVAHALIALRNHEAVNALAIAKLREELLPRVR